MKRFILLVLCTMVATAAIAQNERAIKGVVYNEDNVPIANASIRAAGNKFSVNADGSFAITVPSNTREITAYAEGYHPLTLEIEGLYLIFSLKVNKEYLVAKEMERQAAEQRAAEAAAAAKKRAAEEAAAKEKARKAAEDARIAAAAAKARAERQAQITEECKTHTSGFASVLNLSLAINKQTYAGISYIGGYRINNHYMVGVGAGANLGLGVQESSLAHGETGPLSQGSLYFPIFAHFRANFLNKRFSPFAALSAGANIGMPQTLFLDLVETKYNTLGAFINPQVGLSYRLTPKFGIFAAVGLNCFTAPECIESTGYSATIRQSFNYNININLGVTF